MMIMSREDYKQRRHPTAKSNLLSSSAPSELAVTGVRLTAEQHAGGVMQCTRCTYVRNVAMGQQL